MSAHDPQTEDTRHWSGWTGLAAAIVEQAVSDVRNLIAAGQIVDGTLRELAAHFVIPEVSDLGTARPLELERLTESLNALETCIR